MPSATVIPRDFTFTALRRVLIDIVACFPVYRTYVTENGVEPEDAAVVDAAIAEATRRDPLQSRPSSPSSQVLLPTKAKRPARDGFRDRLALRRKFQQYTAAVSAKGLEDTAFYNDVLLLSTNEVGGGTRAAHEIGA